MKFPFPLDPDRLILDGDLDGKKLHMKTTYVDRSRFLLVNRGVIEPLRVFADHSAFLSKQRDFHLPFTFSSVWRNHQQSVVSSQRAGDSVEYGGREDVKVEVKTDSVVGNNPESLLSRVDNPPS
jgi:hypothetical protein